MGPESSNNATTTLAKAGDTVSVSFTSTDPVTAATIGGKSATVTHGSGDNYTATYQVQAGDSGATAVSVTSVDAAGNARTQTLASAVTIDTTAPNTPTALSASDDVGTVTGTIAAAGLSNDTLPTFSGTAEAGSTVTLKDGANVLGTAVAAANGAWSFTPSTALGEGSHNITATATDVAGNTGDASIALPFTIDTTAPNTPTEAVSASATVTFQGVTYDTNRTPTITGTAEAGSTVTIKDGDTTLGSVTANAQGAYSFTVGNQLSGGEHSFSVTATDLAGNTSSASPVLAKNVVCYMSGTRLQTQDGWKLVEHLKAGDLLKTVCGKLQPVTWLGHSTIDCRRQDNKQHAYPVRIAQHAFGYQLPERDLYVSPLHSIYVEGVMIPAIHLVNGVTVTQDQRESLVTYYHVELPQHDAVYAEGLPAETYLDTSPENRHFFSLNNGDQKVFELGLQFPPCPEGTPVWQHIWNTQGYAPLTQSGPILEAVKVSLMQRAQLVQEAQRLSA